MTSSIQLGRIRGIAIGINWSWFFVFALIVWTLADSVFPAENEGYSSGVYVAMAIVAALLFFTSLLAHELGHAFVALREGMEIDGITLWLFGGVARFKGMFPTAGGEFRIAVAGPLVSLAIGAVCVLVALAPLPEPVDGVVTWLGYINLVLLVFNMLPALPLDGGRVLRSLVWKARNDFASATRTAVSVSRGIAFAMIAGGLFLLIFQGTFSGAWLAFIGWFLLSAAAAEQQAMAAQTAFGDLEVRDLMVRDPVSVSPTLTLGAFMDDVVWRRRFTTYPVVEDGRAVGLVPFRSVARIPRDGWDSHTVGECMVPLGEVPQLEEGTPLLRAFERLAESPVRRGLVLDPSGRLVGLLSISDLARVLELGGPGPSRVPSAPRDGEPGREP